MNSSLKQMNFEQIDAATGEQKKKLLRLAADELRVNQTSIRFHAAYRKVMDEGWSAKDALTEMVKFEDRARQEWVDRSLQPWCDRHGLTLKQGLSVLFDDHPFNPGDPAKDLVTKDSVFGWAGQQNDFAYRLLEDMQNIAAQSVDPALHTSEMFNTCAASIAGGVLKLDSGTTIDLLKVQAACNSAFQGLGQYEFAEAANEMAKATGVVQGPHGEWLSSDESKSGSCASRPPSQPAEAGFEIHGVQRWEVMEGSTDAVPGEPTYTVKVRARNGQVGIEVMAAEAFVAMNEFQAGSIDDRDPRLALPCLELTLEINEGLPCVHVHGGFIRELAQTVFALPDSKVAIRMVDHSGMKDAVISVPDSYMPDFDEAHALFAAIQNIDLDSQVDPEAQQ